MRQGHGTGGEERLSSHKGVAYAGSASAPYLAQPKSECEFPTGVLSYMKPDLHLP